MDNSRFTVQKRSVGVNFDEEGKAEILVWAPVASEVDLICLKSSHKIALLKKDDGYWELSTQELKTNDSYKIQLNGEMQRPDPASLAQSEGVHGASTAIDLNTFKWTDDSWHNYPLKDYILYELHTGTFSEQGTFKGIEEKLDYLIQLGITAIEIMPVAQFPGSRNWGYDGVLPFAVQDSYGGAHGLQQLVNACHNKGIAVVLDVVYNHLGPEGNYMGDFGPFFTKKYGIPWGEAVNLDDAWCDGVRHYIVENVMMWFRDFHIDAVRMDAVHALKDFSAKNILQEIREATDELMAYTGRTYHLMVECDLNDTRYINPVEKGGYGMDAQWIDEFHHALRITAGGDKTGYYSDFNGIHHLAKAYKDAYVYDGIYSPHRKKMFGSKAQNNTGDQFIVFSQNHDQVGNRMLGERPSVLFSFEMQKLMAGAVMVSPYIPMLFMGEEYSETNPFLYFVSHTDPQLRKIVSEGRKKEFEAFHALGEAPDPSDEQTFNDSKLQWNLIQREPNRTMLKFYEKLISVRKENEILKEMDRRSLDVEYDEKKQTLILHRWNSNHQFICLMNFSKSQQPFSAPHYNGQSQILLDSASPEWNGPANADTTGHEIILQPESFIIYV